MSHAVGGRESNRWVISQKILDAIDELDRDSGAEQASKLDRYRLRNE